MIPNYSDPIVTLTQVYKASEEGTVPTLGACIIGPHYIVRKYEDFGKALQLNSADNYSTDYATVYTYAAGLPARPYPARNSADGDIDLSSVKVFVKDAQLEFSVYSSSNYTFAILEDRDTFAIASISDSEDVVFMDPYRDGDFVEVMPGDIARITIVDGSDSFGIDSEVIGFMKDDNGKYTKCVISKYIPTGAVISAVKFYKVKDCFVNELSVVAAAKTVTVNGNATSEDLDLGDGNAVAYPIYTGAFYAEYRVRSNQFVNSYGQVADVDYVEALLGKICPENPLGIAVASAVEESEGNFVYFVALENDSSDSASILAAYERALDLIADKDGIYGIVPCTDNQEVAKAILQFVEKQSSEDIPYFKYLYASKDIPAEELMLGDLTITAVATDTAGEDSGDAIWTKVTFSGSPLLSIGTIVNGDTLKYGNGYEAIIRSSNHKNIIWLAGNVTATLTTSSASAIYKTLKDNASIIEAIIAWKEISNKRCSFCIADGAMYNSTIPVKNFCVAAALAGKRSGTYPHAPLSNVAMKAITTTDEHGFTTSMSKKLGAAGFWRVGMREDGTCISRRQLTSAATGDVNYDEQSIVCNIDSIGLSLKVTGRDLVGNTNISPTLINILKAELQAKLAKYKIYVDDFIGPQLLDGNVLFVKQDSIYKDRIYASLDGQPPKPFNRFHITFYMR